MLRASERDLGLGNLTEPTDSSQCSIQNKLRITTRDDRQSKSPPTLSIASGPDRRAAFYVYLIELTARAHSLVAIRLHEYVTVRSGYSDTDHADVSRCDRRSSGSPSGT